MSCTKKVKYTCGTRTPSTCVFYDLNVPNYSNLKDEECLTIEETTDDLYQLITSIKETIDISTFEKDCLDIDKKEDSYTNNNVFLIKDVLKALKDEVCEIKRKEGEDEGTLSLDFKCLTTPCGDSISNIKELLQVLIDEICNLKNQ